LSDDFEVVGVATDGTKAVEIARHVQPDAIVLDVEMPGLDGFQTLRALDRDGATPPAVFLSMHTSDAIVSEAFRSGARGYVLKTRVGRDLVNALEQALLGRYFVPSLRLLPHVAEGGGHAMQVQSSVESSVDEVAAFFDQALQRGDATCVVATPMLRERLANRLSGFGWDVSGSPEDKRYLAIDAAEALGRVMRNGLPDRDRVAEVVAELEQYRRETSDEKSSRLTFYGIAAGLLCAEGNPPAAIALERIWNDLTRGLPFLTLCGYNASCFHDGVPDFWSDTSAEHSVLSHAKDV
jgi:CheY-like chemotaxis protein